MAVAVARSALRRAAAASARGGFAELPRWQAGSHGASPASLVQTRSFAKYARYGLWTRGDAGMYTMDDPRIFDNKMPRRKYPYFKQSQKTKPYICKRFGLSAPEGSAVRFSLGRALRRYRHIRCDQID
eukprot:TRINITY_DN5068_c0_g2_i2.p1 TRINITY_DN5068_c0_g2~~TRINITY_DN5068_c0_g2_i2.p1  ORF type:complete len:148 (-),score=21.83 TRINITY_DN5068_c0_g2_i2:72-455(-)